MTAKRCVIAGVIALIALAAPATAADYVLPPAMKAQKADYCAECHRTLSGGMGLAVAEWKKSVHARRDDNCNICHGGNPDLNDKKLAKAAVHSFVGKPDKKIAADFCGRGGCHRSSVAAFKTSPHYGTLLRGGSPGCVSCHGSHDIQAPTVGMIQAKTCTSCHTAGEIEKTLASLSEIEASIRSIDKDAAYLLGKNAESRDISAKLADVKVLFHRLVHVMSTREVQYTRREIGLLLRDLGNTSGTRVLIAKRLDLIYFATLALIFIVIITFLIFTVRAFSRKEE